MTQSMKETSSEKEQPLVSIVTPSFNQGRFIEETILSVKNQSYPNIEHIVVDGGSTDNTVEILKMYESSYNLRWISEPDKGQADAVNKGFALSQGEIIGWLNSDDVYFDRDVIRIVVQEFQRHPEADIIYGDIVFISEDGLILKVQCVPSFSYSRLLRGCFIEQPAVFLRRNVIEKYQLDTGLRYAMDYEYWLRIGKEYHFHHLPRILAADRNYSGRKMIAQWDELIKESDKVRRKYGQTYGLEYFIGRYVDKLVSGVPRRLKGLILLLAFYGKQDYAFNAYRDSLLATIQRQLFSDIRSLASSKNI